jgi:hypothetical protein
MSPKFSFGLILECLLWLLDSNIVAINKGSLFAFIISLKTLRNIVTQLPFSASYSLFILYSMQILNPKIECIVVFIHVPSSSKKYSTLVPSKLILRYVLKRLFECSYSIIIMAE